MTVLRGAGIAFNLDRAVCQVIMNARDGAGEIRCPWGELVVGHAFTSSDYDSASPAVKASACPPFEPGRVERKLSSFA
jgi:hypothetical protein